MQSERLGDGREHEVGITDGCQGHQADAVCKVGREGVGGRQQEASFADPAWTGEGEQAHLGATQQGRELGEFLRAAKQRGEWIWQGVEWFLTCARCNSGWECNDGVLYSPRSSTAYRE